MSRRKLSWERKLWGVLFIADGKAEFLIGTAWAKERNAFQCHPLEPSRTLLFMTRRTAREWCKKGNAYYRSQDGVCGTWRFRPVPVRETVRPIRASTAPRGGREG